MMDWEMGRRMNWPRYVGVEPDEEPLWAKKWASTKGNKSSVVECDSSITGQDIKWFKGTVGTGGISTGMSFDHVAWKKKWASRRREGNKSSEGNKGKS